VTRDRDGNTIQGRSLRYVSVQDDYKDVLYAKNSHYQYSLNFNRNAEKIRL